MKRVEGVEDLNSRTICAQGIVGVGAITRTSTSSRRAVASRAMGNGGLRWTPNVGQPEPLPKV